MNLYENTPFDLSGKNAIVAGGGGLLGREFCKALASAGAGVAIADKDKDCIKHAEGDVRRSVPDSDIYSVLFDIKNADSVLKCVDAIKQRFGGIDILVNSAAIDPKFDRDSDISSFSSFPLFPESLWNDSIQVNLTGAFLLTQQVCRIMERHGKGSIINLGSNYGLVGPDQRIYRKKGESQQNYKPVVYSVCKAGIIGFSKYLAAYYSGTEIRVNVLTPSGVYNNHGDEFSDTYSSRTILRRMANKEEFWGGVIFLASDASSYMTGSNLIIDGGWTAL